MTTRALVAIVGRAAVGGATTGTGSATLEAIIAREYARLVRLAGAICREPADAQDAVADAIERALRHRAALRDPSSTVAWLNQIVVREAIRLDGRRRTWWGRLLGGPREIELPCDAHALAGRLAAPGSLPADHHQLAGAPPASPPAVVGRGREVPGDSRASGRPWDAGRGRIRAALSTDQRRCRRDGLLRRTGGVRAPGCCRHLDRGSRRDPARARAGPSARRTRGARLRARPVPRAADHPL